MVEHEAHAVVGIACSSPSVLQRFVFAMAGCLCLTVAWAQGLQVLELRFRTAAEVIPVLQPLLDRDAVLTGQDYTLFVRTSAGNLAQLKAVLAQIDRQPRQLLVTVRRSTRQDIARERASISATLRSGNAGLSVNESGRSRSGATLSAAQSADRTQGGGLASAQVMEGNTALISSGASVPVVTVVRGGGARQPWITGSTTFRQIGSGFLVTPRVHGQEVTLEIEQHHDQLGRGSIDTQSMATQVSGPLGQWIALGGVNEVSTVTRTGVLGRERVTAGDERLIWVKVDALN